MYSNPWAKTKSNGIYDDFWSYIFHSWFRYIIIRGRSFFLPGYPLRAIFSDVCRRIMSSLEVTLNQNSFRLKCWGHFIYKENYRCLSPTQNQIKRKSSDILYLSSKVDVMAATRRIKPKNDTSDVSESQQSRLYCFSFIDIRRRCFRCLLAFHSPPSSFMCRSILLFSQVTSLILAGYFSYSREWCIDQIPWSHRQSL